MTSLKPIILVLLSLFFGQTSIAQKIIKGHVADSTNQIPIPHASILILQAKDSILTTFTRSDAAGNFNIQIPDTNEVIVLVKHPNYAAFAETIQPNQNTALPISLISKAELLETVFIKAKAQAIHLKGDTTEFLADSFYTKKNASVEDLLKKLPGLEVDRQGNIKAFGQEVKKVLVDGEEFFSSDPTLATRNLRADMVEKVQVYEGKSKKAQFTGLDDGKREQTVNIKLKKDKKNGMFGKVALAGSLNGYHQSQAMFNYFNGNNKFSAYGTIANTGLRGLNYRENDQLGINGDRELLATGVIQVSGDDDLADNFMGSYEGQGLPLAQTGGVHFDTKNDEGTNKLNLNYRIARNSYHGNTLTQSENNLAGTKQFSSTTENFRTVKDIQNTTNQGQIDLSKTTRLKIGTKTYWGHSSRQSQYSSQTLRQDSSKINEGENDIDANMHFTNSSNQLSLIHKLNDNGQNITAYFGYDYNQENGHKNVYALNQFYNENEILDSSTLLNQWKNSRQKKTQSSYSLSFAQPLSRHASLTFSYAGNIAKSTANTFSYNFDNQSNTYKTGFDSTFSNNYAFNQNTQGGGLHFNYNTTKWLVNSTFNLSNVNLQQTNYFDHKKKNRNFAYYENSLMLTYSPSRKTRYFLNYNGSTNLPTISELQPLIINDNPLQISQGNESLKPAFSYFLTGYFQKQLKHERYLFVVFSYNATLHPIVSNQLYDTTSGKMISTFVNGKTTQQLNSYVYYSFQDKNYYHTLRPSWMKTIDNSLINGAYNQYSNEQWMFNYNINRRMDSTKKWDYSISLSPAYNRSSFSISDTKYHYFSLNADVNTSYDLPHHFFIGTDLNYNYQQKTAGLAKRNLWLLNPQFGKKFFKNESLVIQLVAHDILNQNKGFSRNINNTQFVQSWNTVIRRYILLECKWNFNKTFHH